MAIATRLVMPLLLVVLCGCNKPAAPESLTAKSSAPPVESPAETRDREIEAAFDAWGAYKVSADSSDADFGRKEELEKAYKAVVHRHAEPFRPTLAKLTRYFQGDDDEIFFQAYSSVRTFAKKGVDVDMGQMLDGALSAMQGLYPQGGKPSPSEFRGFTEVYERYRLEEKLSHADAIAKIVDWKKI